MHRDMKFLLAWVSMAVAVATASAVNVNVSLVTVDAQGRSCPIDDRQALWESPFGGLAATVWPFVLCVDDTPILEYRTASQKLEAKTMGNGAMVSDASMDAMVEGVFGSENAVKVEELLSSSLRRRATQSIDLGSGSHVIQPFGFEFTVAGDGTITTRDARLRIDVKTRTVGVICYPVTVKMAQAKRSVSGPVRLIYKSAALLSGIENMLAEYDKQNFQAAGTAAKSGFRSIRVYLPPSAAGAAYDVNGAKFELGADGKVKLAPDAKASCADGRLVLLDVPAAATVAAAKSPLGVSWFGGPGEVRLACESESVVVNPGVKSVGGIWNTEQAGSTGSGMLMVPAAGNPTVQIAGLGVRLQASDNRWPHRHLVCDLAGGACWAVETAPLEAKPGSEWSCRIASAAGKAAVPAALKVSLESIVGGPTGGDIDLKAADGVFTGKLPSKPGLWRLRVAATDGSPLKGQTLGAVLIGDKPAAAVSLFTVNNRALMRRGDTFDLLWVARRPAGSAAAEWPVRLRGVGLDAVVGRLAIPAAGGGSPTASGRLVVDTSALGVGEYTAAVEADGVAGFPFRFRICQRERLSDFDVYSWPIHTTAALPFPGSPVNSYVGGANMGTPATAPFLADSDVGLDGVFGAYANAPLGPLPEMFARPGMDERIGMALASMGVENAPGWPQAHSYEVCNPKHTLPENLAWVRRRMALFAQTHADYPGVDGFDYGWNWQTSGKGYWGDDGPGRLDAWQPEAAAQSDAVARKLTQEMWPNVVKKYANLKPIGKTLSDKWPKELADIPGLTEAQMGYVNSVEPNGWSLLLPNTFAEWYADLNEIMPGMTHHAHVSSSVLGGSIKYWEWLGKTHRASIDFSERFMSPFDGWISPAIMAMDNREKQKIQLAVQSHGWRSEDIPSLFAAAGRGVDGFAFTDFSDKSPLDAIGRGRVFERFGSWFVSFDPLPDVALYCTGDRNVERTALHDLARIRRPGVMVGPRDVAAGELLKYKVLLLLGIGDNLPPEILDGFRAFAAKGGVILKDDACHKSVPGRSIGMAYQGKALGGSWGGAQAGGEYEHTYIWQIFLEKQATLIKAFADTPQPPVMTPDTDALISPLAGKDSIICFVIDKTEIPLEVTFPDEKSSRFHQGQVLPKVSELQVEKGWYVHNLLTGKAAPTESTAKGLRVPISLTGAEGQIYLLTRQKPENMVIQAERASAAIVRLTGGLVDGQGKPLADPMPFELTLKGPDGATLFHKFASIGPDHPFDLPVPAMSAGARAELVVRDLVLGTTATQALEPSAPAAVTVRQTPDLIGGEKKIMAFFSERKNKGPVTIVLDEGQEAYRPAAEKMAEMLRKSGREARVTTFDTADIRPLHLRWYPQPEDVEVVRSVTNDFAWAYRIDMNIMAIFEKDKSGKLVQVAYTNPAAGYAEMGPRLRHDADVVLFGQPSDNRVAADLTPWLRRKPTAVYPAPGGFFVHYLWSPFRASYDALYVGCRDVAGAEAAVACLSGLKVPEPVQMAKPTEKSVTIRGGQPGSLENMQVALGGTPVLNVEYTPSGNRLIAITFGYGEWVFVLDADGKIVEHLMPPETAVWPSWYRWGRGATPLSDTLLRIYLWDNMYQYELGRGWISRAQKASMVEDKEAGRGFLGGPDRLIAMDPKGAILWTYEDGTMSTDLTIVREVVPKALNGDKSILLASAFSRGNKQLFAPAVIALDAATGRVLWKRDGVPLSAGKIITLGDRFLIMADDSSVHELIAKSGQAGTAMSALTGSPDWVLEVAGRKLVIAENSQFNRKGPACRVYLRPLAGGADQNLDVQGRVLSMEVASDKQSFVVATTLNRLLRFSADGALLWQTETQPCNIVRVSPDGKSVAAAGNDGVVRVFNAADGKLRNEADLNVYNNITADAYAKQKRMGELPWEADRTPQTPPPEPSYLKSIPKSAVPFGPNLAPPETMQTLLKPAGNLKLPGEKPGYMGLLTEAVKLPPFDVKAGTTYLVELLDMVGVPTNTESLLRLEIAVVGSKKAKNLPCTARLPVDASLKRRRFAFRADADDQVTLTLRPIMPVAPGDKKGDRSFDKVEVSKIPIAMGDVVVSAMNFPGQNVLFDGGPSARAKPYGTFECTLYPMSDGKNATVKITVKKPGVALQLVNNMIANSKTDWDPIAGQRKEGVVAYAEAVTQFKSGCGMSAVVVYEDISGPVIGDGGSVRERAATRYSVDVHKVGGDWVRIGTVIDNTQLVNVFPCPEAKLDGIRYVWAGRYDDQDRKRTDGFVRTAQIEAYATDSELNVEELLDTKDGGF
ncbi:MAG: PQQ-binding-like beta-propeller repeat protein [bacterium]